MASFSSNICQEVQVQTKPSKIKPEKDLFAEACYDSLPAINNSSKFIFDVGSFSDAATFINDYNVFTAPNGNHSFLSKNWMSIEVNKIKEKSNLPEDLDDNSFYGSYHTIQSRMSEDTKFLLNSLAPYGFEYERDYINATDYSLPDSKQESLHAYKPKFLNFKMYVHRLRENNKAIYETDFFMRCTYILETNTLHPTLIKKSVRKITFWKESKNLIQQKGLGLKLSFEDVYLSPSFRSLLFKYAEKNIPQIAPLLNYNSHRFSYWRKVFKNQFWTDIHSRYACEMLKSKHEKYNSIMYHYKKYGTKKARQILYETTSKAMMRKYEELEVCAVPEAIRATKLLLEKGVTLEKCLRYLTVTLENLKDKPVYIKRSSNIYSDVFFEYLYKVQEHYPMVTYDKLLKIEPREAYVEIRDIAMSLSRLDQILEAETEGSVFILPEFTDVKDLPTLSTRLADVLMMYKNKEDFIPFKHLAELEEKYNFEDEQFIYKAARSPSELRECGNELNICVGSYGSRAKSRQCDIIFVRKKSDPNNYYGCIEVSDKNNLRQVKLRRNERGSSNADLNTSVLQWAEDREINPETCYDISVSEKLTANNSDERINLRPFLADNFQLDGLF